MMKKIFAIAILLISVTSGIAQTQSNSPFSGTWEANFDGCIETWVFDDNGIRKTFSNKEETINQCVITKIEEGLYGVVDTRISSNAKEDCSGEIADTPVGHVIKCRLKFTDNDTFVICFPKRCLDATPYRRKK
jgi:hypothetical protein